MKTKETIAHVLGAAILISLAWTLRGQFGHMKGALIPGAAAAVLIPLLRLGDPSGKKITRALVLSPLGFALGGHLAYGRLMREMLAQDFWVDVLPGLGVLFLIGAVWGGIGGTFLGFGASRKLMSRTEIITLCGVVPAIFLIIDFSTNSRWNLVFLLLSFCGVQIYNSFVRHSKAVLLTGVCGSAGFGLGFVFAFSLLWAGEHGAFGAGWPWWRLRDQIIGLVGGAAVFIAVKILQVKQGSLEEENESPVSIFARRAGLILLFVFIPCINTWNLFIYWYRELSWLSITGWRSCNAAGFLFFAILTIVIFRFSAASLREITFKRTLLILFIGWLWYLCIIAIAKQIVPYGLTRWEDAYTLFLLSSAYLSFWILGSIKKSS